MPDAHFISYSSADALDFALQLADALLVGPPSFPVWLDKRQLAAGQDWDVQLREAIRSCVSLIFVMSRDSVEDLSVCKEEWSRALSYKKPVTPLLYHAGIEKPFGLGTRQHIDFTGGFERGLAQLRTHLQYLASPAGQLHLLKLRLADATRDQRRASDSQTQQRIADEIALLRQQIATQEYAIANPAAAAQAVQTRIETGLARERQPAQPVSGERRTKFINPPPGSAPYYFQDRTVETRLLVEQLKSTNKRLFTVVGRGGVGKTAMTCRLLKGIEAGHLPDDLGQEIGELTIDGIIYLSQNGTRQILAANLFADLGKLLPATEAQQLDALYRDPQITTEAKVKTLLTHFAHQRVLVLLDNLEDQIDPATRQLTNIELHELLTALLRAPVHGVQVLCTTRIAPQNLALVQPQLQTTLVLDEGLGSPYAENILRAMDADGKLGLQRADESLLNTARERTLGYPRALEALVAILSSDRATTLPELLGDNRTFLPEYVVETLVGEAYSRLDHTAQLVMQALAIYARPVTAAAIDYLLQPYLPSVNAVTLLNRLVNMYFVRKENDRYYLHPVDRAYALQRIPEGSAGDGTEDDPTITSPFTCYALWHRAADYFAQARCPRTEWKMLADLAAPLAEFDLRCSATEYIAAADLLNEISAYYLLLWGHVRLLVELHERLRGNLHDPRQMGRYLGMLGNAYEDMGQVAQAVVSYEQALALAKEMSNRRAEAVHLNNLGNAYSKMGEATRALGYYEQALMIAQESNDRRSEGMYLSNLGNVYYGLSELLRSRIYYEQALAIAKEIGDRGGEANNLGNVGNAYLMLGEAARAIYCQEQALTIARDIGHRSGEGGHLSSLGNAYLRLGEISSAINYYEQAVIIAKDIDNRHSEANNLGNLGNAYFMLGAVSGAIGYHEQALTITQEIGDRRGQGRHLSALGSEYAALGAASRALDNYAQALAIAQEINDRYNESLTLIYQGLTWLDQQASAKASQALLRSSHIADAIHNVECRAEVEVALTSLHLLNNDLIAALSTAQTAQAVAYRRLQHRVLSLQGVIAVRQGRQGVANEYFSAVIAEVDHLLGHTAQNYAALESKGLALCGFVLDNASTPLDVQNWMIEAKSAYRAARAITRAPGIVQRTLRLFDALAVADVAGVLIEVRAALTGD